MASSLIIAASVGTATAEALKDQAGLCRWNYALRSIKNSAKSKVGPFSEVKRISKIYPEDKAKRSEESLRTVMYLSCWGPY
ncbi:Wound-induced protein [Carex littledalei]|uniref:Wound-induced protein n=1 Tax=Carex littledalei TaxID=544730 RepID=A0A833QWU4_9POAL|nr:Wound-induced protein [Carex littledalei]